MTQTRKRIVSVLVLALAICALPAVVIMTAKTMRSAAGDGAGGLYRLQNSKQADAALHRSTDHWLKAQPLSAHPPAALPTEFWHATSAQHQARQALNDQRLAVVSDGRLRNVVLHSDDGQVYELTRFNQPQHVYDMAISPDGRLAWVWHMTLPPRQVSVYDLATGALLHRFEPMVGGELRWAQHEPLLLLSTGGQGMGGSRVTVFTIEGATVLQTAIGHYAISPDDRWVFTITFANGSGTAAVFHIATGERIFHGKLPARLGLATVEAQWNTAEGPMLRMVDDAHGLHTTISLSQFIPYLDRANDT